MGKLGRFACVITPMVLTTISLILLLVILLGGWNKNDSNLSSLYTFSADTTAFKKNVTASGILGTNLPGTVDDKLRNFLTGLSSSNSNKNLSDVYQVYLWNYCSGSKNGTSNATVLTYCSPRQARFWFNPVQVWGLNSSGIAELIPNDLERGLNIYKGASQWLFIAYAVAFLAAVANIVVGLFALCSRWGSCCTTVVSCLATLFAFLAALTSTILFSVLTGTFNTVLRTYGIRLTIGRKALSLDWVAFAFSLGATLFWTVSICCCSGKSEKRRHGGEKEFAQPRFGSKGYQPLDERNGYVQQGNVEMGALPGYSGSPYKGRETAYEPFRSAR